MSAADGTNTAFVLGEVFRTMDLPPEKRDAANLRNWADEFPYVNGGLFTGAGPRPALVVAGFDRVGGEAEFDGSAF